MRRTMNEEACTGCYACYVACIAEHHTPQEEAAESFCTIKKRRTEGFEKQIVTGCTHCGRCIAACRAEAIYREETYGIVLVDQEKCTGCRQCEAVCQEEAVRFNTAGKMEKCDGCIRRLKEGREPACLRVCQTGAIAFDSLKQM